MAVIALLFGGLTLLVTKALVMAKLAFLAASALGIQKLLSNGSLSGISGKVSTFLRFSTLRVPGSTLWYGPLKGRQR